jgi:cell division protease FtsH
VAPKNSKRRSDPENRNKRAGIYLLIAILVLAASYFWALDLIRPRVEGDVKRVDQFMSLVEAGRIHDVTLLEVDGIVTGNYVTDNGSVGHYYSLYLKSPGGVGFFTSFLLQSGLPLNVDQQNGKRMAQLATSTLPPILLLMVFIYIAFSFWTGTGLFGTRSGARKIEPEDTGVTFDDVAGHEEAIAELREIVEFLKHPERFREIGAAMPKGVLIYGPPGCGKTLLARALASEASASFYSISGSDFVEVWAGVAAARVRDLFKEARANAPAIVFIDEVDSIGRSRSVGTSFDAEYEQGLNQILSELDGFTPFDEVVVVAATNRPDVLDAALLRPGRFDRAIGLERPGEEMRREVLKVHSRNKKLDTNADLDAIAGESIGLSGADLANLINEAALLSARAGKKAIAQENLEEALQRIIREPERRKLLSLREQQVGRRTSSADERVTFADVAGVDSALEELTEIIDYLGNPDHFERMGARAPRGVMLVGPPGCGKTLLARAVAGEANASFFSVAATEFVEVLVGRGASRVRTLFTEARAASPAIIFIDEIDAVAGRRSSMSEGGTREVENTMNQMLVELDGFDPRVGVVVMAATNRPDMLDPALTRPGRFDRQVTIEPPDRDGRRQILDLHSRDKPLASDVDLDEIAGLTRGFSGADLANLMNEATLLAMRKHQEAITRELIDEALDRSALGVSSRGNVMTEEERRIVAYHEVGHALVGRSLPGALSPIKISIAGRGRSLGFMRPFEEADRMIRTRDSLIDELAGLLGGRAAELIVFGDSSAGAADDLMKVSDLAYRMVTQLGMGGTLGPLTISNGQNGYGRVHSEELAKTIDREVREIIDEADRRASDVLKSSRGKMDKVVQVLVERERPDPQLPELEGKQPVLRGSFSRSRASYCKQTHRRPLRSIPGRPVLA